jgi:hypothetical protein
MSISYDPSKSPDWDPKAMQLARQIGMIPFDVTCNEPDAKPDDHTGVQFNVFAYAVPRIGELITLQDGTVARVTDVIHKVAKPPDGPFTALMAHVIACRIGRAVLPPPG